MVAKQTAKRYKCTQCQHVTWQTTNHYGATWSFGRWNTCPNCPPYAKYMEYGGQTIWECIDKPSRKFQFVILVHNTDRRVLCKDGKRRMHADPSTFKTYKRVGNALRFHPDFTARHVYEGDTISASGEVCYD